MINLLPPDVKQDYLYGLHNTALRRWAAALVVSLVGLGLITTYGLLTLKSSTKNYSDQVTSTQTTLKNEKLAETEAQVTTITDNLKLVVKVLDKEVLFSKLLTQIATVIPARSSLTNLNINQAVGGIDITAQAADYTTATQVQVNLSDTKNQIFSKADIISIACSPNPTNPKYPCTVQIRALFGDNNPFLFVNTKAP